MDARVEPLSALCLALPEAERVDYEPHAQFRVRKRTFTYFLDDHHGDGIVGLTCKGPHELIAAHPDRFYMPAYLGPRGWVALRLDVGEIDWAEVEDLVTGSYLQIAPKRLAALLTG